MALLRCIPFSFFTTSQLLRVFHRSDMIGNISIGDTGPGGSRAMRFAASDTSGIEARLLPVSGSTAIIGSRFRINTAHGSGFNTGWTVTLGDGSAAGPMQCSLDINAAGQFEVCRGWLGSRVVLHTSTYTVPLNTWVDIWIKFVVGNAPTGACVVKVWEGDDMVGQVVVNQSGLDTQDQVTSAWDGCGIGDLSDAGTTDYEWVVVMDGSGAHLNDIIGRVDVTALWASDRDTPALTQWSLSAGSNQAQLIDDPVADDDATSLSESTQNEQMAVPVDPVPYPTRPILGAQLFAAVKLTSGSPTLRGIGYESAVANLGATLSPTSSYKYLQGPYSEMPSGAAFTTAEAFDALQWGLKLTTSSTAATVTQVVVALMQEREAAEDAPDYVITIGDEVGINPLLETFRIQETLDGNTTLVCDVDSGGSPYQRFTLNDSVTVTENGVRIFGGVVTGLRERAFGGVNGGAIVVEIQATSYAINAKRRYLTESVSGSPGPTLKEWLTSLITNYLSALGVSLHPDQADGPTLESFNFERTLISEAINTVTESIGYLWTIDFQDRLRAWAPGDIGAPEDIDEATTTVFTGDVEKEEQLAEGYANHVTIVGEGILVPDFYDAFVGDGVTDTFNLTYKIAGPYPNTPDGQGAVAFGVVLYPATGTTESIAGLNAPIGFIWEYDPINLTIKRRSGAPANGVAFSLPYHGLFEPNAVAQDAGEIATYGLWEHVEQVTSVPDDLSAQGLADAILAKRLASKDEFVTYQTRDLGYHPGQFQNLIVPSRVVSADFLLTQVETYAKQGSQILIRRVKCAKSLNNDADWRKVYRQWYGTSGASSSSSSTTSVTADSGAGAGLGLHAAHHILGGIDPIDVEDLRATDGSDGDVLTRDGAGSYWAPPPGAGSPGSGDPADIILTDAYASRPAAGYEGRLFFPNNGFYVERDTGSIWQPWGPIYPMKPPVDGDFAWVNQGGASVDTTNGGIFLLAPATAGTNLRVRVKTAPTAPYTITAALLPRAPGINFSGVGLCFRQSSDGKIATLGLEHSTDWSVVAHKFTNATTFSANYTSLNLGTVYSPLFFQISDNNTNRIVRISADGQHWLQIHSVSRTDFLTANQVGFYASADQATWDCAVTLLSWKET